MPRDLVPRIAIGPELVLAPYPGSFDDPHDLDPVGGDDDGFGHDRRWLRTVLDGHAAPRVLAHVVADGTDGRPRGACVGCVEEWAGEVHLRELMAASRAAGGTLLIGVCLSLARAFATPFAALERIAPTRHIWLDEGVFIDVDGMVRCLVEPFPPWHDEHLDPDAVGVLRRPLSYVAAIDDDG